MRGATVFVVAMVLGAGLLAVQARAELPSNCSETSGTITCGFGFTGGPQTWSVPTAVRSATFDVFGAQGEPANISLGGAGGEAKATLAVTLGDSIEIVVGGAGGPFGSAGFNGAVRAARRARALGGPVAVVEHRMCGPARARAL